MNTLKKYEFYLENLDCANCANKIQYKFTENKFYYNVVVNFNTLKLSFETEDDIENGIVGGLISDPIEPETNSDLITGEAFIKPKITYTYTYKGLGEVNWVFDKKLPIEVIEQNKESISIKWTKGYSGQFVLSCGKQEKTIVVESLF